MKEITFIVRKDAVDGGYVAKAHWDDGNRDIFTEGDTREELIANIKDATDASFDDHEQKPNFALLGEMRL